MSLLHTVAACIASWGASQLATPGLEIALCCVAVYVMLLFLLVVLLLLFVWLYVSYVVSYVSYYYVFVCVQVLRRVQSAPLRGGTTWCAYGQPTNWESGISGRWLNHILYLKGCDSQVHSEFPRDLDDSSNIRHTPRSWKAFAACRASLALLSGPWAWQGKFYIVYIYIYIYI